MEQCTSKIKVMIKVGSINLRIEPQKCRHAELWNCHWNVSLPKKGPSPWAGNQARAAGTLHGWTRNSQESSDMEGKCVRGKGWDRWPRKSREVLSEGSGTRLGRTSLCRVESYEGWEKQREGLQEKHQQQKTCQGNYGPSVEWVRRPSDKRHSKDQSTEYLLWLWLSVVPDPWDQR